MLVFAYLITTAPTLSLRRLSLLFFVVLLGAMVAVSGPHVGNRMNCAVVIAAAIAGVFWTLPLVAFAARLARRDPRAPSAA